MKTLVAIGEALIDFAPQQTGRQIKDTESFMPKVGGAPANVCGAYAKLGGKAVMLTQLGADPFGDKIVEELAHSGIDTTYISRTEEANTSLAFVALLENGDREFTFFRKPGSRYAVSTGTGAGRSVCRCICASFLLGFSRRLSDEAGA